MRPTNSLFITFLALARLMNTLFGILHVRSDLRSDHSHASSTGPPHPCRGRLIICSIHSRNHLTGSFQLSAISHAIRSYALEHQRAKTFKFIQASLLPPKKVDVLNYLGIIPAATPLAGPLLRRADVDVSAMVYLTACV